MSISDWLINQQDLNSSKGIIQDLDKYDDHRIIQGLKKSCMACKSLPQEACKPLTDFEKEIPSQWVHTEREK